MTAVMLISTVPEAGAVHTAVHSVAIIGDTKSFAEAFWLVLISTFGSVVVSTPPAHVDVTRRMLKLFSPIAGSESATVTVIGYANPGVYDPTGRPLTVRKLVVLYVWHPQPPSLSGKATVVLDAGTRTTARRAIAPTTTMRVTLLRAFCPAAALAILLRDLLPLSVIPVLFVKPDVSFPDVLFKTIAST
jgi:hypothetical protein